MTAARPLLHVGYHKTGTAWFQQVYFPHHPDFVQPLHRQEIRRLLVRPHPLDWDAEEARAALLATFEEAWAAGEVPVLSEEELTGNPHLGKFRMPMLARRLHEALPDARVWISIREQEAMVTSLYRQYVRDGGTAPLRAYLAGHEDNQVPPFDPVMLEYDRVVDLYRDRFGEENVLVTLFEDLQRDPRAVSDAICDFAGADPIPVAQLARKRVNTSLSDPSTFLVRKLNRWFRHPGFHTHPTVPLPGRDAVRHLLQRVDRLLGLKRFARYRPAVAEWIGDRYAASNERTSKILDLDLAERGYRV